MTTPTRSLDAGRDDGRTHNSDSQPQDGLADVARGTSIVDASPDAPVSGPDWRAIETEYVQSGLKPSTTELADRYGVPHDTVRKRCTRGNWTEKRSRFWHEASLEAEKKGIATHSEDLAERNAALGEQWYGTACTSLTGARTTQKRSARKANTISAGIATEKHRLVKARITAKAGSVSPYDTYDLPEEECEELLNETIAAAEGQPTTPPALGSVTALAKSGGRQSRRLDNRGCPPSTTQDRAGTATLQRSMGCHATRSRSVRRPRIGLADVRRIYDKCATESARNCARDRPVKS